MLVPFDFVSWLSGNYSGEDMAKLGLSNAHIFEFSTDGVRTKEFGEDEQFSTWRGDDAVTGKSFEPYKVITTEIRSKPKPLQVKEIPSGLYLFC